MALSLAYIPGLSYNGCYTNPDALSSTGIIKGWTGTDPAMTVSVCLGHCLETSGFTYVGLAGGSICSCGLSLAQNTISSVCNTPCVGKPTEGCGGSKNGLSVYHIDDLGLVKAGLLKNLAAGLLTTSSSLSSLPGSNQITSPISTSTISDSSPLPSSNTVPMSTTLAINASTDADSVTKDTSKNAATTTSSSADGMASTTQISSNSSASGTDSSAVAIVTILSPASGSPAIQSQTSPSQEGQKTGQSKMQTIFIIIAAVGGLLLVLLCICACRRRKLKLKDKEALLGSKESAKSQDSQESACVIGENHKMSPDFVDHSEEDCTLKGSEVRESRYHVPLPPPQSHSQKFARNDASSSFNRSISESELFGPMVSEVASAEQSRQLDLNSLQTGQSTTDLTNGRTGWSSRQNSPLLSIATDHLPRLNPPVAKFSTRFTASNFASQLRGVDWRSLRRSQGFATPAIPKLPVASPVFSKRASMESQMSKESVSTRNSTRLSRGLTEVSY